MTGRRQTLTTEGREQPQRALFPRLCREVARAALRAGHVGSANSDREDLHDLPDAAQHYLRFTGV
jgi:hypothetical protein